jgi:hypothetical protein
LSKKNCIFVLIGKEEKMKKHIESTKSNLFRSHKAYSPEEILAAGGATAFGRKSGKDNEKLVEILSLSPKAEPFTDEEWDDTLKQIRENK